jgi:hypothetical protein
MRKGNQRWRDRLKAAASLFAAIRQPSRMTEPVVGLNGVQCKSADLVTEMNAKHCFLLARSRIASRFDGRWVVQRKSEFKALYRNQLVTGSRKSMTLARWWLHHPDRRQCDDMALTDRGLVPSDELERADNREITQALEPRNNVSPLGGTHKQNPALTG